MMKRRKLPIGGVQTFRTLRAEYDVYIDKTAHIYDIATRYGAVFLARPRRFGKSLLCSTMHSLFNCERSVFDGLAISHTDWEWDKRPVIHLEFAGENYSDNGLDRLEININRQLDIACNEYEISIEKSSSISDRFARTIYALFKKYGRVVVIIDEYDNPLINTFNQPKINIKIRDELRGFYSVLKQSEQYLRFVFVTGVTKFAQINLFSGFNQPMDISIAPEYTDICGITQEELEHNFSIEIDEYAEAHGGKEIYLNKLKAFYNGYYFTKEKKSVYNTYGILNHFNAAAEFAPFWSKSGEPAYIRKYLESKEVDFIDIENAEMRAVDFADYKDDAVSLFPLLYQAGYLTISNYDATTGIYKLSYPNVEVRQSLADFLSVNYSKPDSVIKKSTSVKLINSLLNGQPDIFMNMLKIYLSKVDYSLSSKITEYYFEFAVTNIVNMLGLECKNEIHTANGRMDVVIFTSEYIYIFEFKVDKPVQTAIWQMEEKDYALMFSDSGKKIFQIGVVFSRENRNIVDWKEV